MYNKLFEPCISNDFLCSKKTKNDQIEQLATEINKFKCFYCNRFCSSDNERITHTDNEHPGRLYYPNPEDFENRLNR